MRRPRVSRDFVFTPTGVTAGLRLHFEEDEILESALLKTPSRAEPCHAAAYDDYLDLLLSLGSFKLGVIADAVAGWKGIVDKAARDRTSGFGGQANEGGCSDKKYAAARLQSA